MEKEEYGSRDRERIIIEVGRSLGEQQCSQSHGRSEVLQRAGATGVARKLFPCGIQKEQEQMGSRWKLR